MITIFLRPSRKISKLEELPSAFTKIYFYLFIYLFSLGQFRLQEPYPINIRIRNSEAKQKITAVFFIL
jgi:hypothetical protein